MSGAELADALAGPHPPVVLDVREPHEWAAGHLPAARHAPLATVDATLAATLDPAVPVVTVCAVGGRSAVAAARLRALGVVDVRSLARGMRGWADEGRTVVVP